jgi:hypothetical protein
VLRPHVAVDIGSRGPFDGCEIEGTYGRVWPDRFRSHDPVEIALTAAGRRYFADRAAARDLAAFVRSKRVQTIRKEPPEQARGDLDAAFPQLARSAIRIAAGSRLTFSERSTSGRKFSVTVANGRVVHENLRPYAFVF